MDQAQPSGRRLFLLLDRAAHRVRERLEQVCRERLGITAAQLGAVMHLAGHDGIRPGELAGGLGVQPAAVTGLCDRMESAGLVRRKPCPDDARAQRLWLTAAGRKASAGARTLVQQANQRLAQQFTAEELAVVARFLVAVTEIDSAAPAAAEPPTPEREP